MSSQIFTKDRPAKILAIMAHPDDFEFNAGGLFAQLRSHYGEGVILRVINTSTGASGHHLLNADEAFQRRLAEAKASAALIGAEADCLSQLDGSHVQGQVLVSRNLIGGIWNAIRSFGADYVFCPPVVSDPLAGIHVDHEETARAVRLVGYQLGVPQAYPTTGHAPLREYRSPLIILTDDVYSSESNFDVAVDIGNEFGTKVSMAECHVSQVFEWLPFNQGKKPPTRESFAVNFRERHTRINARFAQPDDSPREYYRISNWGRRLQPHDLDLLFPEEKVISPGLRKRFPG